MEQQAEDQKVSKYNSGVAIIMRLDALWQKAHFHVIQSSLSKWNTILDRIWCELARDIKSDEYSKSEEDFKKFDKDLVKIGLIQDQAPEGFRDPTPIEIKKRSDQYRILMDKELFLRRLENKIGKGTAWDEGEEDYMD